MHDDDREVPDEPAPGLLRTVLLSPLWALPFTLFFGTIFGARWPVYRIAFVESFVFTLTIRLALWVVSRWLVPACRRAFVKDS